MWCERFFALVLLTFCNTFVHYRAGYGIGSDSEINVFVSMCFWSFDEKINGYSAEFIRIGSLFVLILSFRCVVDKESSPGILRETFLVVINPGILALFSAYQK